MLEHLLNQSISINVRTGLDGYGRNSYSETTTAYNARVQPKLQMVLDTSGQEKISSAVIYVAGSADIDVEDMITLPDSTTPEIIKITKGIDQYGNTEYRAVYV